MRIFMPIKIHFHYITAPLPCQALNQLFRARFKTMLHKSHFAAAPGNISVIHTAKRSLVFVVCRMRMNRPPFQPLAGAWKNTARRHFAPPAAVSVWNKDPFGRSALIDRAVCLAVDRIDQLIISAHEQIISVRVLRDRRRHNGEIFSLAYAVQDEISFRLVLIDPQP